MLRWLTAGESHGPALVAVLEGLPAGVEVTTDDVAAALARRRLGYGRGARMKFEQDEVEFLGGVRHGAHPGRPGRDPGRQHRVAQVGDGDGRRPGRPADARRAGRATPPLTRPRPGHADLVGMQKYGFDDARPVLERASARETAARVALGAVAAAFLRQALGVEVVSHVVAHRPGRGRRRRARCRGPTTSRRSTPTRCAASTRRRAGRWWPRSTKAAQGRRHPRRRRRGASRYGLPPGLGSHVHWDRRLDARLAGALMGIQAIKGVEVGDGFETAARRGSAAHDEIERGRRRAPAAHAAAPAAPRAACRPASVLRVRAAMKPISTVPAGAAHRRRRHRRGGRRASTSAPTCARCRPPASSPRRWSRWCSPTPCWRSSAATRVAETPPQRRAAYLDALPSAPGDRPSDDADGSVARSAADRPAGPAWALGPPGALRRRGGGSASALRDTDHDVEAAPASRSPRSSSTTASRRSASSSAPRSTARWRSTRASLVARRRRGRSTRAPRGAARARAWSSSRSAVDARRAPARLRPRPLLARQPAGAVGALMDERPPDLRAGRHDHRRHRRTASPPTRSLDEVRPRWRGRRARRGSARAHDAIRVGPDPGRRPAGLRRRRRHRPARRAARRCSARRAAGRRRPPAGAAPRPVRRSARTSPRRASRRSPPRCPTARRRRPRRSPRSAGRCSGRPASPAPTPSSASAGERPPTSPASSRPPGCAASRVVQVPTTLLGDGRRGRGRQDRHQHRRGQEPRRRLPPAGRRAVRPRHARDAAAQRLRRRPGRGRQVRVHRRPGDPRPGRGRPEAAADPDGPVLRELVERAVAVKARVVAEDLREERPAGDPQLRAHPGARDRARRALPVAARRRGRRRHGLRRRARAARRPDAGAASPTASGRCWACSACRRPTGRTAGRSCSTRCAWTRRPAATCSASSSSTTSPGRAGWRARTRRCSSPPTARPGGLKPDVRNCVMPLSSNRATVGHARPAPAADDARRRGRRAPRRRRTRLERLPLPPGARRTESRGRSTWTGCPGGGGASTSPTVSSRPRCSWAPSGRTSSGG